ncbi:hypothetical protein D9758_007063 [Tetrapyrgos nigripes]|uniref:RNA-binding protein VTS1 n=1 Tax=Tetrapyrgos nigripes TaxID=182062 RepID=A0A8H5GDB4_9AGAR|nr:hypothetical protein D9758_007063 [Tetrapyrgos nigripes]
MSLRPPSTSPSPSPGPNENAKNRQSLGPATRGGLVPSSPRPGAGGSGARPTSELLGGSGMFQQTPEAEALDQWFENLQNYEATLEEMAAASLDANFKEELSAIEQWFKVLSEAERTAALYSLLQHSTQVQIRFFITVLQQMARSDPMTALLSPAMGSMQSQMEAKLATLKSPGLKSNLPSSPTTRNFSGSGGPGNRASLALDSTTNFLSPDSAANLSSEAAATLAQRRAEFKASNAAHRISAPVLSAGGDGRGGWSGPASSSLGQVAEQNSGGAQDLVINSSRPKSTEFSGTLGSPRGGSSSQQQQSGGDATVPAGSDSWASMVNTPLIPMFQKNHHNLDAAASKLNEWSSTKNAVPGVPRMGDPTIHRRASKQNNNNDANGHYDDNGNPIGGGGGQQGGGRRNNNNIGGWGAGARSPALSNTSSNRFGGSDDGGMNPLNGLGMQMGVGGFGLGMGNLPNMGMGSPGLGPMGMPNLAAMNGMNGMNAMSPFNMNMLSAMGISPEAQLLAAQMALQQPGFFNQMQAQNSPGSAGIGNNRRGMQNNRGLKTPGSASSSGATPKGEEDVDPQLLTDIPAWLRSLRLHKYTPNFEGMKWQDMVVLDEAQLEAQGVAALGARRKMLKTFELVRKKMGIEGGPPSLPPSATTA